MEQTLRIRLLGDFSLIYDDRQVTSLNGMRLQSLLAYLVLHRDVPQQRQHLAFLFWPETTEAQARNNLRQLLHQLRQAFPPVEHFLSSDTHAVHWHPVTPFHLDVAEFEEVLTLANAATLSDDQRALQSALELAVMMNGSCLSESSSASALHVYHTCVTTLQRELGVDPDLATRTIYERLLQQETP